MSKPREKAEDGQIIHSEFSFINSEQPERRPEQPGELEHELAAPFCILLIEDNRLMLESLRSALHAAGIGVIAAERCGLAKRLFSAHGARISALIVDECLPDGSGRELIGELRRSRPDLKAVLMSGYFNDDYSPPTLDGPHSAFLFKPFSIPRVIELLRAWQEREAALSPA